MAIEFDNYVWRLYTGAPDNYDLVLPKDLEWIDEFSWNPVSHDVKTTLTGGIIIQEYVKQTGRPITLVGQDNMGWMKRSDIKILHEMSMQTQLFMTLDFVQGSLNENTQIWTFGAVEETFNVMFDHSNTPVDVESVKRFDNFESGSWFKIKTLSFMEVPGNVLDPC